MNTYQSHVLEGASPVELTIALYAGIVRFMNEAIEAVELNDVDRRRSAVKRAMDIVMHLQVTLDRSRGGKPAESLSEFYTAMFALMLQGSQSNSKQKFEQVIANVRNVWEAWKRVLNETARTALPEKLELPVGEQMHSPMSWTGSERASWSA